MRIRKGSIDSFAVFMSGLFYRGLVAAALAIIGTNIIGANIGHAQAKPANSDIPPGFTAPRSGYDYTKRVVMVPMRDGVKLYTVIVVPKGALHAPVLLTRTP